MKHYEYEEDQRFVDTAKALLNTNRTFQDIYEMATTIHGLETACIYFDEDGKKQSYNYEKYKTKTFYLAQRLSTALSAVPAGSTVALKLKNCPTWPHMFWAILMTGHIPLLINSALPHDNTQNLLNQASAKAIIANEEKGYDVLSLRFNKITNSEIDDNFNPTWANQVIFCSSGTTGAAKMMVSDGNANCEQIASAIDMPKEALLILHPGVTNILAMIPFHHIFGFTAVFLWYTFYGKAIVYPTSMSTKDIISAVKEGKVTHLYSVPMFWDGVAQALERSATLKGPRLEEMIHKMIAFNTGKISGREAGVAAWPMFKRMIQRQVLGTQIEYCISGGGYLNKKTLNIINGLGYPLYNGFGMTEIGVTSVELSPRIEDRLKGAIGHPLHGFSYRIEPIAGATPGQGELLVKAPTIHVEEIIGGVKGKPKLTKDGYFHTGDIAEIDNTGEYYIKGRMKDVIINSNGENVYPDEIEFYFKGIRHVVNSVVIGVKKAQSEEETITLILELDNNVKKDDLPKIKADALAINATLPNEKKVQDILIYKRAMPISNSMKIKRFVLKDALEKGDFTDFMGFDDKEKVSVSSLFAKYDTKEVNKIIETLRNIYAKTLLIPLFKVDNAANFSKDLGGDSMSYVGMVDDINKAFHLSIPTELYGRLVSVNDFALEILQLTHPKVSSKEKGQQK